MDTTRVFRLVYRFSLVLFAVGVLGENEKPEPSKKEKTPSPLYEFREIHDRDGIGKFYFDREIAHVMGHLGAGWLERGSREVEEAPTKLIKALKVTKGMKIADIGAGSGYFSRRLARSIGKDGLVYAVDIQPEMLEILGANMKKAGLENFRPILGGEKDPKLPDESVDLLSLIHI